MKTIKINQKLMLEQKIIAQLDSNQLKMIEGGGVGVGNTNTCVCTWKTCGCTYTCETQYTTPL